MANTFQKVTFSNASPRGGGSNRLNSIPAKAKHLNDLVDSIEQGRGSSYTAHANWGYVNCAIVDNTTAFVRNADSIVTWVQPANTLLTGISILFPSAVYSTGTGNSLGFEVGTSAGGGEIVTKEVDQIIDVGTDGTDLATGAKVDCTLIVPTEDGVTLATNTAYTATARTIHLNTVETSNAAAIVTAGTARWIIKYLRTA